MRLQIHPTAIVHPEANIHESCEIGPFCSVGKGVRLGPENILLSHVVIQNCTTVGAANVFHPFSVIGGEPQDLKYSGENTEVKIGNKNTIRESVTINIGTAGGGGVTQIGDGNLLMAYVHIAHDVKVGNSTVLGNASQLAGHVLIEDYSIVGGLTGISQFVRLGEHTYVGGCSGVDRDVPPFAMGRGLSSSFEIWGMNLIGLKRRGFSSEVISSLQEVSTIFFKDKSTEKEVALRKIEEKLGQVMEVQHFLKFVRASQKGVYR